MSRLDGVLERKKRRVEALNTALAGTLDHLRELGALKVILFGSLARGEADLGSDLDLLVVMPADRTGREWTRLVNMGLPREVATDVLVYAEDELARETPRNSFLRRTLSEGRVVYEKALQ